MYKGLLFAVFSGLVFLLLSLLHIDSDRFLLGIFFDQRGAIRDPKKISLVVISDKDYEEPLKLSPKYKPTSEIYINLLQKILTASPEIILVDSEELPEIDEKLKELFKNDKIRTFQEKLYIEDKVAYHFPKESELFTYIKHSQEKLSKRVPSYINFYGPQDTLDKISFTDALHGDESNLQKLRDKLVIVSRESAIFQKGHIESKRYYVPLTSPQISSAEIKGTILSNLVDETYFIELNKTYIYISIVFVFIISLTLSLIPDFWVSMFSLIGFSLLTSFGVYKGIFQSYLWGNGISAIVILPRIALLIHMIVSMIRIAKTYYKTRKDFYMD